jgi:hypothetical protein
MEPCAQRGEISKIKTIVNDLQHIIKGNGQPGMQTTMIQILTAQEQMIKSVNDLTTNVSALVKFQVQIDTDKNRIYLQKADTILQLSVYKYDIKTQSPKFKL